MPTFPRVTRRAVVICTLILLGVNFCVVSDLFSAEYLAYTGSIEGTFIAIARVMVEQPAQWKWWPLWNGGMPFENTYLPLTPAATAALSSATGLSPARSFHVVMAGVFILSALALFWMALELSRRLWPSFIAALIYSCFSFSAVLIPSIAAEMGRSIDLRRLHLIVFYGETPHLASVAILALAVICFHRAFASAGPWWKILAGIAAAGVVLSNAFGAVALAGALLAWLCAFSRASWWKTLLPLAAIGMASYCWVSPWLSFSMLRAILANSATAGGDYRYRPATWLALAGLTAGYLLLWWILRRVRAAAYLQFFSLFGYLFTTIVVMGFGWNLAIVPQPSRYQVEVDWALPFVAVFAVATIFARLPRLARSTAVSLVLVVLLVQTVHAARYARQLIRTVEPTHLSEYKIAKWLETHRPGERTFVGGSTLLLLNAFSDIPQIQGGHNQHSVSVMAPIADFTIRTGMNAGSRDVEYSLLWLRTLGARTVVVSGTGSTEYYRTYVNPHKFDGVLPLVWRDGGDSIYQVPVRSSSLAHVIPLSAVPARKPVHGLDVAPLRAYVDGIEDSRYPLASFVWEGSSQARIRTSVERGQVIAVQITYERGWEAWSNGRRQTVRGDALGQMVIEPDCAGPCEILLRYTGGAEAVITRIMSLSAMLLALAYAWKGAKGTKCQSQEER